MNPIDITLYTLIAVSILVLAYLFFSQWKKLRLIDISAMPKAKLKSKKYQLIEERFERKTKDFWSRWLERISPATDTIAHMFRSIQVRVIRLERKYRHQLPMQTHEDKEKVRQKVAALLAKGQELFDAGNYGDAEIQFLDCIRLSPQEVEAYEYLADIAVKKREFEHAIESLKFALKLSPNEDRLCYNLAHLYDEKGDIDTAVKTMKQCMKLAPNNPKNLDAMVNLAIKIGDRVLAVSTLKALRVVNPENEKLSELEERVRGL
ncbi:MAG: tetratricopeptide repeat protein [Candidatus Kerfeldbacteria bacterium]|nr:tetratricopeptide repeat protein [Candidatus Kerfeldbacteria bacterium]